MDTWFYPCDRCSTPEDCDRCDYYCVCKKLEAYSGREINGQQNASKTFDDYLSRMCNR